MPEEDRLEHLRQRTRYAPAEVEARVFARWEEAGIFHPEPEGTRTRTTRSRSRRPNVTGALHMGHALNGSIQDVLIRLARMRGRRTKWIFGTDHAGIATQVQGRAGCWPSEGTTQGGPRPRGVHRARLGVARAVRLARSSSSSSASGASLRLRGRALHDGRRLRARGDARVRARSTRRA